MQGVVHHTSQPEFCTQCHIMRSSYVSWDQSLHRQKKVGCMGCHSGIGFLGMLQTKLLSLKKAYAFYQENYKNPIKTKVQNEVCIECHDNVLKPQLIQMELNGNIVIRWQKCTMHRDSNHWCTECHIKDSHDKNPLSKCFYERKPCLTCHDGKKVPMETVKLQKGCFADETQK